MICPADVTCTPRVETPWDYNALAGDDKQGDLGVPEDGRPVTAAASVCGRTRAELRSRMRSLLALPSLALLACASTPAYVPRPIDPQGPLPLWTVETADGKPAGFLFGTFHVLPKDDRLDPRVLAALAGCDALVLEVSPELDDEDKAVVERITQEHGVYPAGEPGLDERLPGEQYRQLEDAAGEAGVPGFVLKRMRPWLAVSVATIGQAKKAGFDPDNGVEKQLVAARGGVPLVELESVESQLMAMAALPDEVFLSDTAVVDPGGTPGNELPALYEAWHHGDVDAIERLTFAPLAKEPRLKPMYDTMFFQRNDAMAQAVLARLRAGGRPFVAVGSGHMVGERGLVAQLRAAGFVVTQVSRRGRRAAQRTRATAQRTRRIVRTGSRMALNASAIA